jgi:hypothetical protein
MTRDALILAAAAFGVWALAFVLFYGGLSLGCAYGWTGPALRAALLGTFAATLVAGGLLLRQARPLGRSARIAAAAALASSLLTFWPVATLSLCG